MPAPSHPSHRDVQSYLHLVYFTVFSLCTQRRWGESFSVCWRRTPPHSCPSPAGLSNRVPEPCARHSSVLRISVLHLETALNFFFQSINLSPFKMLMSKALKTQVREIKHVYKHVETVSEKTHETLVTVSDGRACPGMGGGVETAFLHALNFMLRIYTEK